MKKCRVITLLCVRLTKQSFFNKVLWFDVCKTVYFAKLRSHEECCCFKTYKCFLEMKSCCHNLTKPKTWQANWNAPKKGRWQAIMRYISPLLLCGKVANTCSLSVLFGNLKTWPCITQHFFMYYNVTLCDSKSPQRIIAPNHVPI